MTIHAPRKTGFGPRISGKKKKKMKSTSIYLRQGCVEGKIAFQAREDKR